MTTMDQIHRIRMLYYEQGKTLTEIAAIMHLEWRTVRKYVDMEDFNTSLPTPEKDAISNSKLDPFKPLIDEWLTADKKAPRTNPNPTRFIKTNMRQVSILLFRATCKICGSCYNLSIRILSFIKI